jgi:hypothetical protein
MFDIVFGCDLGLGWYFSCEDVSADKGCGG